MADQSDPSRAVMDAADRPPSCVTTTTSTGTNEGGTGGGEEEKAGRKDEGVAPRRTTPFRRRGVVAAGTVAVLAAAAIACLVAVAVVLGSRSRAVDNDADDPRVDLGYAVYAGTRLSVYPPSDAGGAAHNTSAAPVVVHRFVGMRYAAPPTGDGRWRAPAPPPNTTAVQAAKEFGPVCLGMGVQPGHGQDEDCLYVNVWAPDAVADSDGDDGGEGLPVWVFIQGGGYTANTNANYEGADVVARSGGRLVFVNFNYRVGVYGFLASERLRSGSGGGGGGALNAGLLDQRFLLAWVQAHIAAFGGNPAHVVLHGASAGAGSVALHTLAYGGRDDGLFAGAVAESVFFPTQPTVAELEYKFDRAVAAAGCQDEDGDEDGDQKVLACLRARSAAELQRTVNVASPLAWPGQDNATTEATTRATTAAPAFYWGPCVDGDLLVDRPYALLRAGRFVRVPLLYGVASDEGTLFAANATSAAEVAQMLVNNYPGLGSGDDASDDSLAASVVAAHYPQVTPALPQHAAWFPTLAQAYGELTFVCGAVTVLDAVANATGAAEPAGPPRLFAYRYAMQDPALAAAGLGTVHMMDGAAVFGPDNIGCCAPGSYYGGGSSGSTVEEDDNPGLVPVMMDYYISFVRSLDPNTHKSAHAAAWPTWRAAEAAAAAEDGNNSTSSSAGGRRLVIVTGRNQTVETVPDDQAARCRVWQSLADATEQ